MQLFNYTYVITTKQLNMSDYKITIASMLDSCPFNPKRKSNKYCEVCSSKNNPCKGIGVEKVISTKKIDIYKVRQILNIIK